MNQQEFTALAAQGYNRIPVSRQVLADFDTPLSAYRKLAAGPYTYLFESVEARRSGRRVGIRDGGEGRVPGRGRRGRPT